MGNAYLSLGSNIGDRLKNLQTAVDALRLLPNTKVMAVSSVYETEPVGLKEQCNFYNIAVKLETSLSPRCLLGTCLGIEAAMGRIRNIKNGPRIIDIDLILYDNERYKDEELTLPHKEMNNRAFVLAPLAEIGGTKKGDVFSYSEVIKTEKKIRLEQNRTI